MGTPFPFSSFCLASCQSVQGDVAEDASLTHCTTTRESCPKRVHSRTFAGLTVTLAGLSPLPPCPLPRAGGFSVSMGPGPDGKWDVGKGFFQWTDPDGSIHQSWKLQKTQWKAPKTDMNRVNPDVYHWLPSLGPRPSRISRLDVQCSRPGMLACLRVWNGKERERTWRPRDEGREWCGVWNVSPSRHVTDAG